MAVTTYEPVSWERMSNAVEKFTNACCAPLARWIKPVFPTPWPKATPSPRGFLASMKPALQQSGFVFRHVKGIDMFLDGADAKARDAVHIVFAAEKVRADYLVTAPDVSENEPAEQFRLLSLEALVRMKLTSFRDKDRVHVRDLIDVGLVDAGWLPRLPASLRPRLQQLLDNPEG